MEKVDNQVKSKGRPKKTRKKLVLTFEEIYRKIQDSRFHIVYMKSNMVPYIYSEAEHVFYQMPPGYIEFDKEKRKRGYL